MKGSGNSLQEAGSHNEVYITAEKLDLGEIDLTSPLHFPSASALEQDLGIINLDIVRG